MNEKEKKSVSELLMDDIEPINRMEDEGGPVNAGYIHPTEYDESDDLEAVKASIEKKKSM